MSWFTNLFSSNKNTRNSRTTISSTHEAFSLPTSSPRHPADMFHSSTPSTPEPPSVAASTYSYPPSSPSGAYDYVPAATGSRSSRKSTLLPLHNASQGAAGAPYPPLAQTWARLRQWLSNEYPELGDTLNYGILPQDLAQIEMTFGFALPQSIRDSYLCTDGQEAESAAGCAEGLFFGLTLLPLEDVLEEWRFWREVDGDPNTGANPRLKELMDSIPPGWVRKEYSSRGWIPLVADKAGNYLGVDLSPGEEGQVGQVIVFGRDFDTKVVMFRGQGVHGWAQWLSGFVDDLEGGEGFELGTTNDTSEGSEDSVGYESYFFDGVGRGLGDGGGDTGTGGMRLTGEYRGWNVLEAWADKSMRKWQELGLVPTLVPSSSKGKAIEHLPDETLKAVSNVTSAAEVPIPVLTHPSASSPNSRPLANVTNRDSMSHRQPLPTIAVTKPPAPLPVNLPTQDDIIITLDSESPTRNHIDIESGGDMVMREIPGPTSGSIPTRSTNTIQLSSSASTIKQHAATESIPAPIPPPPTSPSLANATPVRTAPTSPKPPAAAPSVDLLADSAPALKTAPIPPSTPIPTEPASSVQSEDSPVLINSEDVPQPSSLDISDLSRWGESSPSNDGILVSDPELDGLEDVPVGNDITTPEKSAEHEKVDSVSSVLSVDLQKLGIAGESKGKTDSISTPEAVMV